MHYYEANVNVFLKHKIYFSNSPEVISKFLAKLFIYSGDKSHFQNRFKYVFSNFQNPKNRCYSDNTSFVFRSFEKKYFDMLFDGEYEDKFLILKNVEIKRVKYTPIKALININPVIVRIDRKKDIYWSIEKNGDLVFLVRQITNNLIKKLKFFTGEEIETDSFIKRIRLKNIKPFSLYYNNHRFIGHKFAFEVKEDEASQKLAFCALANGMGEKNSLIGAGFTKQISKILD
ncbi:CRISPR-associated endoribonuclease Cas6 [Caminibacter sp.]